MCFARCASRGVLRVVCFAKSRFFQKYFFEFVLNFFWFFLKKVRKFFHRNLILFRANRFPWLAIEQISIPAVQKHAYLPPPTKKCCPNGRKTIVCENVAFGQQNWENVAFGQQVISERLALEIRKMLDFVYTNPSQASHLDAKKKTKTKVFWKNHDFHVLEY